MEYTHEAKVIRETTLGIEAGTAVASLQNFSSAYRTTANDAINAWAHGDSSYSEETILALHDGWGVLQKDLNELIERVFKPLIEGNTNTHADHLHKFDDYLLDVTNEMEVEDLDWADIQ